jgi:hypothetical protein
MEYKGFDIIVRQTLSRGYRWSVNHGEREKAGIAPDRSTAITKAKEYIDGWLKRHGRSKPKDNGAGQP